MGQKDDFNREEPSLAREVDALTELVGIFLKSEFVCLVLAVVGEWLAVGAATFWAVRSRRHWFLKAAVIGVAVAPAWLLFGYHMVLLFLIQAFVSAGYMALIAFGQAGRSCRVESQPARLRWPRLQFTLTDLFLMIAVIAAVLGVVVATPARIRPDCEEPCYAWMVIGGLWFGLMSGGFGGGLLLEVFWSKRPPDRLSVWMNRTRFRRLLRRVGIVLSCSFLLILLLSSCAFAALLHLHMRQTPIPELALPEPNGYEDLARAAEELPDYAQMPSLQEATPAELEQFLSEYGHVLPIARQGLARECRVPLTYTWTDTGRDGDVPYLLARAFLAEGKLAEREGRTESALDSYLDIMRLGGVSVRGGLACDALTQWSVLRLGAGGLASVRGRLSVEQCRRAAEVAACVEGNIEPAEDVLARHAVWAECVRGSLWRLVDSDVPRRRREVEQLTLWNRVRMRLLICELAIEQYRLERGAEPSALTDLVPEYLASVPRDPCGGGPLRYRQTASGALVYSVGPDGRDDGGRPMEQWDTEVVVPGDVLLTEPKLIYLHWF